MNVFVTSGVYFGCFIKLINTIIQMKALIVKYICSSVFSCVFKLKVENRKKQTFLCPVNRRLCLKYIELTIACS